MGARTVPIVLSAMLTSGGPDFAAPDKPLSKSVQGVGVVTAIDPKAQQLTINHEEIKGFMGAMEMPYPLAHPGLLTGLKVGDKIQFVINRRKGLIVGLKVTGRAP